MNWFSRKLKVEENSGNQKLGIQFFGLYPSLKITENDAYKYKAEQVRNTMKTNVWNMKIVFVLIN